MLLGTLLDLHPDMFTERLKGTSEDILQNVPEGTLICVKDAESDGYLIGRKLDGQILCFPGQSAEMQRAYLCVLPPLIQELYDATKP